MASKIIECSSKFEYDVLLAWELKWLFTLTLLNV